MFFTCSYRASGSGSSSLGARGFLPSAPLSLQLGVGAHGWVAGIASHGSVSLSRGWLISVEAPRHPGHLSSIQLDAVVKDTVGIKLAHKTLIPSILEWQ